MIGGRDGYRQVVEAMDRNASYVERQLAETGRFEVVGADEPQLPLACFRLDGDRKGGCTRPSGGG